MKSNILSIGWSACRLLAVSFAGMAIMTGCGTDMLAGVGSGGTGVFKASLSGATSDGYLINAIVFMDKNGNYQLDSGEPYAVTDVDGACKLVVDPADVGAYPVVAVALKGLTIDSASMQAVASNYVLSFPKESFNSGGSNIISPLSSQLRELLETGRYTTVKQAQDALVNRMGLPSDINLLAENFAAGNPTLSAAAKSIAALMWMQTEQIMAAGSVTPALDVERYRTMMALIESNMLIVSKLNTPENLTNLNNNITVVLTAMPSQAAQAYRDINIVSGAK